MFSASVAKQETKTGEQIQITEGSTIKLIREKSSGRNIFDAEQTVISKNEDGTIKNSMIKETYANITIRKKRQRESDGQSSNNHEISGALLSDPSPIIGNACQCLPNSLSD